MPIQANDDFTEGADTALQSHTPSGSGASNKSWFAGSGLITVLAATDVAVDDNAASGNRYILQHDLGSNAYDLQADFTSLGAAGSLLAFGFLYNQFIATLRSYEVGYDHSLGASGQWYITDPLGGTFVDEAWPGGTVTMKAEIRKQTINLYVNSVLKVTRVVTLGTHNPYAGIKLLNFAGSVRQLTCDNYTSVGVGQGSSLMPSIDIRPNAFAPGLAR